MQNPTESRFTFIDLFAGIGGFRKAVEEIGGSCVFSSEWNSYAVATYQANFDTSHHSVRGDIRSLDVIQDVPDHNLLVAGFPCQPFSLAGISKKLSLGRPHGFHDLTQGTLFFEIVRILAIRRPSFVLLENVRNLLSHDQGRTFAVIAGALEDLGYTVQYRVIDAQHFVPQHRQRVFVVAALGATDFDLNSIQLPSRGTDQNLKSILHACGTPTDSDLRYCDEYGQPLPKYTISDKLWSYLREYAARQKARGNGFGFGLGRLDGISRTLSARYYKDGAEILIPQEGMNPRRLTPRECSRLMGFDTAQGSEWQIPVSDTQAYRQFGNAVVVPVAHHLAQSLEPYLHHAGGYLPFAVRQNEIRLDGQLEYSHS